ncbi:MAG: host specificity protein, partial [Hyphomicrobiales bacterium]
RYKDLKSWWSNLHYDWVSGVQSASPTDWIPGSKPIRFTEYGCAAVDKGSNQPNRFIDVKSSESGLPAWSNGRRDDLVQMQYLIAVSQYWNESANNPLSGVYGGPMVDMGHAFAWAWDARPFPEFPGQFEVWSDAANYSRGHWLNGRASNQPLPSVVQEICKNSGLEQIDTTRLYGLVRGYQQSDIATARSSLQPLMLAYGFDVSEREGELVFRNRTAQIASHLDNKSLARMTDLDGLFEVARSSEIDTAGQIRLGYVDAQSSYELRSVETRFPDEEALAVSVTDLPLALTKTEGLGAVERWLAEARVARDTIKFALPKSRIEIGTGDVVGLGGGRYRIDRVEQTDSQLVEAVRVEAGVYLPADRLEGFTPVRAFTPPVPVVPVFLDLPLLTGQEVPHAPHIALGADPWPGSVAVWSSSEDAGYEINRLIAAPAVIGVTETAMSAHRPGVWDRGESLRVKIVGGELSSASPTAVLNGANAMAIGDGSTGNWEVFQFADAQIVAPDTFDLSTRLRGQLGTDGIMPSVWPVGSTVVLIDLALQQIDLAASSRGLARYYRVGSAARGYDDSNVVLRVEAFDGIGLRPYPVAHLRQTTTSGDVQLTWKRRTRIEGDTWQSTEVPLGEESQAYLLRIIQSAAVVAEYTVAQPAFAYTAAMRATDGVSGAFEVSVAQLSASFGPGPFRQVNVVV